MKIPVIKLSSENPTINGMIFDESMRNYSTVILELDSIESQKIFDETFEKVTQFYKKYKLGIQKFSC